MWRYYEVLLHATEQDIKKMKESITLQGVNPMDLKKKMAHQVIDRFWSPQEAQQAQEMFEELF